MGDRGPEPTKTYRVVGNPYVSHRKQSAATPFVWIIAGGVSCALVIYIVRLLADWF